MDNMTSSAWQRRGTSIIFDRESLADFIADDRIIPLRQALAWLRGCPAEAPGRTIVIAGLESVLETAEPEQAEAFLRNRMQALARTLQAIWPECGLVFGFAAPAGAFVESGMDEAVRFRLRNRREVRLSEALWGGTEAVDMRRLVRENARNKEEIIGYHVARLS